MRHGAKVRERTTCFTHARSPVGRLLLVGDVEAGELALSGIYFEEAARSVKLAEHAREDGRLFASVRAQLDEYFAGERSAFELVLAPRGTAFQREVWRALMSIPYGTKTTYGAIARAVGRPKAVRAVGAANGQNPLPIVVPCHRVIGRDGTLTGYGGGLDRKRLLLDLEARHAARLGEAHPGR